MRPCRACSKRWPSAIRKGRACGADGGGPARGGGHHPARPDAAGSHRGCDSPHRRRCGLLGRGRRRRRRPCPPGVGRLPGRAAQPRCSPPPGTTSIRASATCPTARRCTEPWPDTTRPCATRPTSSMPWAARSSTRCSRRSVETGSRLFGDDRRARHLRPAVRPLVAVPEPRGDARACPACRRCRRSGSAQVVRHRARRALRGRPGPRDGGGRHDLGLLHARRHRRLASAGRTTSTRRSPSSATATRRRTSPFTRRSRVTTSSSPSPWSPRTWRPPARSSSTPPVRRAGASTAERLADEMGLYSDDLARMGLFAADAWRASRLVVDTGLHA